MQGISTQNLPLPTLYRPSNNPHDSETELPSLQQRNPTPQIPSEAETETDPHHPSLPAEQPGNLRALMPRGSQRTSGLRANLEYTGLIETEQDCFLRKTCVIVASMIIWVAMTIKEDSPDKRLEFMGRIAFCGIIYTTLENILICVRQDLAINHIKERLFDIIDGVLALCFLIFLQLWDEVSPHKYLVISLLWACLISVVLYRRMGARFPVLIRGICYAVQISLFATKLQGYNTLDYSIILIPAGLYLAGHQIYGSYILVFKSSIRFYRQVGLEDLSFVRSCLRKSWNVIHYGLIIIVFGVFVDLWNEAAIKEFKESIRTPLTIMQVYNGLLLAFSVIFFRYMRKYDPELCENSENSTTGRIKPNELKEKYSLVAQDGLLICNFLKISPTYFVKADGPQDQKNQETSFEWNEAEETSCYICEENQPDVIIMGCGHGGMCKECVLLSMEKNSSCMQCRKPAQSIYQIKNEDKALRIVEACEVFNIDYEGN